MIYDDVTTDAGGITARTNRTDAAGQSESYSYGHDVLASTARRSETSGSGRQSAAHSMVPTLPRIPSADASSESGAARRGIPPLHIAAGPRAGPDAGPAVSERAPSTAASRPEQDDKPFSLDDLPEGVVLPADLREALDDMAGKRNSVNKDEFRRKAKERVLEQAFVRCLEDVEQYASKGNRTLEEAQEQQNKWRSDLEREKEREKEKMKQLKATLDSQIALSQLRAKEAELSKKASVSSFILPNDAGLAPSPLGILYDEHGNVINSRQKINKDLEQQIRQNAERKARNKKETAAKERSYLERLSVEVELQEAVERSEHLEKQRALLEAWERDGHLRNLRKLTPFGSQSVKTYINTNMADTLPASMLESIGASKSTATSGFLSSSALPAPKPDTPTLGAKLNMSIGYDPRKGRVG